MAIIKQSDNPLSASSQDMNSSNETAMVLPAGSTVTTQEISQGKTNVTQVKLSEPTPFSKKEIHTKAATIGAAQTDTSKALAAKYKALLPVMIVGILFILGGAALAYFGWWTKAVILWAIGVLMITFAAVLPGHEVLIISVGVGIAIFAVLLVLYVYHKGLLDQYVTAAQNELDKITANHSPNPALAGNAPAGPLG